MALTVVTVRSDVQRSRTQSTTLDGVRYRLKFHYSKSGDFWTVDIADTAGTVLVAGMRLALGVDLLKPYKYKDGMPQGQLFCYDTARTDVEPGLADFDGRVQLIYRPAAEVVA